MITVCPCQVCSEKIEFDADSAGQTTACPHCNADTLLFIPSGGRPASGSPRSKNRRLLTALALGSGLLVLLLLVLGRFSILNELVLLTGSTAMAIGALVVAVLVLVWAVLWIVFPVFVYFLLRRQSELLEQIERNTRK